MSDPTNCKRHAHILRYEDEINNNSCNGCYLGEAEQIRAKAVDKTAAAIKAYQQSSTQANKERLSDAVFELEAKLLFPDNNPVYVLAWQHLAR
jgi:hypothetical protein